MTLQELKDNREQIINFINERGYNLKFAMQMAVELSGNCDSIEELENELIQYLRPVKETKTARILGRLAEIELENN
jgi:hypothetical protein